jgi:hypothetical protein
MGISVPTNGTTYVPNLGSGGTVAAPLGLLAGDLVLLSLDSGSALGTVTLPLGWSSTSVGGISNTSIFDQTFWHLATGADSGGWVFSWVNNSIQAQAVLRIYRGVDQVTPIDATWQTASGTGTPDTAAAITVATANAFVESHLVAVNNVTWTAPVTTPATTLYRSTAGGNDVFYEGPVSAGALAARTFTPSGTTGRWVSSSIAIRPSAAITHSGLTFSGSISVSTPAAIKVVMTGSLSTGGQGLGNPTRYFGLGNIAWATANGPLRNYYLEHSTELILAPMTDATTIYYSFAGGITGAITELTAP